MLSYLQHYTVELAAYAQLVRAPDEWGFFTSKRAILDFREHATQHMSLSLFGLQFHSYRVFLDDPICIWESVECWLSIMERMLQELHEEAENCGSIHSVPPLGPIDLGARLSNPCFKYGTHAIRMCSGRKYCG